MPQLYWKSNWAYQILKSLIWPVWLTGHNVMWSWLHRTRLEIWRIAMPTVDNLQRLMHKISNTYFSKICAKAITSSGKYYHHQGRISQYPKWITGITIHARYWWTRWLMVNNENWEISRAYLGKWIWSLSSRYTCPLPPQITQDRLSHTIPHSSKQFRLCPCHRLHMGGMGSGRVICGGRGQVYRED